MKQETKEYLDLLRDVRKDLKELHEKSENRDYLIDFSHEYDKWLSKAYCIFSKYDTLIMNSKYAKAFKTINSMLNKVIIDHTTKHYGSYVSNNLIKMNLIRDEMPNKYIRYKAYICGFLICNQIDEPISMEITEEYYLEAYLKDTMLILANAFMIEGATRNTDRWVDLIYFCF